MKILKSQGYTLIELIVVMVILGILAASAAPKFVNLQTDAKITRLKGLAGAIKSANSLVHAKAIVSGANLGNGWDTSKQKQSSDATVEIDGTKYFIKYGYLDRVHVLGALQGTEAFTIKNGMATDDANSNTCSAKTCEYEWCGCKGNPGAISGYKFNSGDAQVIVPNGATPSNYATEKCFLLYINATENDPPKTVLFTDGC